MPWNVTHAALIAAAPEKRRYLLLELSEREGIHLQPAEPEDGVIPLLMMPSTRSSGGGRFAAGPGTRIPAPSTARKACGPALRWRAMPTMLLGHAARRAH